MKDQLVTIKLTSKQAAHLKSFLRYAYNYYTLNPKTMKEDVEISLIELIAAIKDQT